MVAAFAQTTLVQYVSTGLRHIDWPLLVVVYISLQRDPAQALLTATAAGLLKDAATGGQALGVSGIAYLLAAYLGDRVSAIIMVDNLLVRIGAVAAASIINIIAQLISYQILKFEITPLTGQDSVLATIIFALIANLSMAILFYRVLDRIFVSRSKQSLRRTEAMRGLRRMKMKGIKRRY